MIAGAGSDNYVGIILYVGGSTAWKEEGENNRKKEESGDGAA